MAYNEEVVYMTSMVTITNVKTHIDAINLELMKLSQNLGYIDDDVAKILENIIAQMRGIEYDVENDK
jgi:hypothetical protein